MPVLTPVQAAQLRAAADVGDPSALELLSVGAALAARDDPAALAEVLGIGVPAQHHRLILREAAALARDDADMLIVLAPPGSAKSTYISVALPVWLLLRDPRVAILSAAHTVQLAERWGRRVRNIVASPEFRALGGTSIASDSTAAARWATTDGGEYMAFGTGSAALGYRCDWLLLDDPISGIEQALSETQLEKVLQWFDVDALTRLKPRGKLVLIQQRMSFNDLAGHLMRRHAGNPRLRVVTLRMVAEDDDDPLGRKPGEMLWPEWYTSGQLTEAQRDPVSWSCLYQQRPLLDTGGWCAPESIQYYDEPIDAGATGMKLFAASDFATGAAAGDFTVHVLVGVDVDTQGARHLYVHRLSRRRCDPAAAIAEMMEWARAYHVREWYIDDDFFAKTLKGLIAEKRRIEQAPLYLKPIPIRGQDKETRASALRFMLSEQRVHLPRGAHFTAALVHELLGFPVLAGPGNDDQVDALGLIAKAIRFSQSLPQPVKMRRFTFRDPRNPDAVPDTILLPVPERSR